MGGGIKSKASFCGTKATRTNGEPVQAKPCGRASPGLDRTSAVRILFHTCKTKPNRKPDISLAISSGHLDVLRTVHFACEPTRVAGSIYDRTRNFTWTVHRSV